MYHPSLDADAEYIELLNISAAGVTLYDAVKAKAWRISEGITFEFSSTAPLTMAPGERVILTKNLAHFNAVFGAGVPAGTKILEWITGGLSNSGENLQIDRPGAVDALNILQYVREDRVNYSDTIPWPSGPDGTGPSLTKISEKDYGNDFINWTASAGSPGSVAPGSRFASWASTHGVAGGSDDPDKDGVVNLMEYALGTNPQVSSPSDSPLFSMGSHQVQIRYEVDTTVPDVDYFLETSTDLNLWTTVDAVPVSMVDGRQTRVFDDSTNGLSHRFYRLGIRLKP